MADDPLRVRQHRVLGHPALDVDVGRRLAELARVAVAADRDEHAHGERCELVDHPAVERREDVARWAATEPKVT